MKIPRWLLYAGAAGLLLLAVVEAVLHVVGHDDLWWNLATGRYISEHGEIPATDVFSHTFADNHWVNLEWLSHVLFYNLWQHLGESSLLALRAGMIALIFAVVLGLCLIRSRGSWLISLLVVAFGAGVCRQFLDARPQLFTFLFAALVLLLLELFRRHGRRKPLFLIPLILLLWTQLHGGYIFGLLVLLGNLGAELGKKLLQLPAGELSWRDLRLLAVVTLLAAAAIAVNPWTVEAYTHPFDMSELVGGGNAFLSVIEWKPPSFLKAEHFSPLSFWPFLLLVALALLPIAIVRWRSFDCNDVGLVAVLAVFFALQHRRFIPLFVLLTLPSLAWAVRFWIDYFFHGRKNRDTWSPDSSLPAAAAERVRGVAVWIALAAWIFFALTGVNRINWLRARYSGGESLVRINLHYPYYPDAAIEWIRETGIPGRMVNLYNWGGFLHFFLPEHKTFIDGRAQTVYGDDFYLTYLKVHFARRDWKQILEHYGVTWALLHQQTQADLFHAMNRDPEWTLVFVHDTSAVFLAEVDENLELLTHLRSRRLPRTAARH